MKRGGRRPGEHRIHAAYAELRDLVRTRCLALGGVPVDDPIGIHSVGLIVPTRHGPLWVWGNHVSEFLTVFARFDDPRRAKVLWDANPFTGKWNHHAGTIRDGVTPQEAFDLWARNMKMVEGGDQTEVQAALQAARDSSAQLRAALQAAEERGAS